MHAYGGRGGHIVLQGASLSSYPKDAQDRKCLLTPGVSFTSVLLLYTHTLQMAVPGLEFVTWSWCCLLSSSKRAAGVRDSSKRGPEGLCSCSLPGSHQACKVESASSLHFPCFSPGFSKISEPPESKSPHLALVREFEGRMFEQ